jgi:hypothetical protein
MRKSIPVLLLLSTTACTTVEVTEVDASEYPMQMVCIERNDEVIIDDFLSVLEQGFLRHGVEVAVYDGRQADSCEYSLWYTAERGWDISPYLDFAELRLKRHGRTIGTATYKHAGGFALNKWAATSEKIDPIIDSLLVDFAVAAN